jgi:hypothetical protein
MPTIVPRSLIHAIGAAVLLALPSCEPWFMSKTPVDVSGEFRSDGSCNARIGGSPLFSELDSARTTYLSGGIVNMAPGGYEVHVIDCRRAASPPDWNRAVHFMFSLPAGARAPLGRYTLVGGGPLTSAPMTMQGAFFDPRYDAGTPGSGTAAGGQVYLRSISGEANFSRMDSARDASRVQSDTAIVVGTYVAKGVRNWGMN